MNMNEDGFDDDILNGFDDEGEGDENNEDLETLFEETISDIDMKLESLTELLDHASIERSLYFVVMNINGHSLFAGISTTPEKTNELILGMKEVLQNDTVTFTIQENILFKKPNELHPTQQS